eukprot:4444404-Heterocapsa_arctica.AAC.1
MKGVDGGAVEDAEGAICDEDAAFAVSYPKDCCASERAMDSMMACCSSTISSCVCSSCSMSAPPTSASEVLTAAS